MLNTVLNAAAEAGQLILSYYQTQSGEFQTKQDHSPVTEADIASHQFLKKALTQCLNVPVLSEEDPPPYEKRKDWKSFWLIDPLDGTKEYLKRTDEFAINIALIDEGRPKLAIILAPVQNEAFYAEEGHGAFVKRNGKTARLPLVSPAKEGVAMSRFHSSNQTSRIDQFLRDNSITRTKVVGASLKFCQIAEGLIHLYPRFSPCKEWDIAAGHLIVKESGGGIFDLRTRKEPIYNSTTLESPHFLAYAAGVDYQKIVI